MAVSIGDDVRVHPLTVDALEQMIAVGAFGPEDRVELVGGVLVEMSPPTTAHTWAATWLAAFFLGAVAGRATVLTRLPVKLDDLSMPQPDLALVASGGYRDRRPTDPFLVIEVSDRSLAFDLNTKLRRYAAAGVADYWVVDVAAGVVRVHRDPVGERYATVSAHARGERIAVARFADIVVDVGELLGPIAR